MKFWQKTLLIVLTLFIAVLDICILIFMQKNWSNNLEREMQRVQSEHMLVSNNLLGNLNSIQSRGSAIDDQMFSDMIHSYSRYYEKQGTYLELWKGDKQLFPRSIYAIDDFKKGLKIVKENESHFIKIGSTFPLPYQNFQLRYRRDISYLYENQTEINRLFLIANIIACSFLAILLYVVIRQLTIPLRDLSQTSAKIAKGDYAQRITIKSKDEFEEVAENFNLMAGSIEKHMVELSSRAEEKQRMVDNLAHELRTPLTAMQGFSETILSGNLDETEMQKAIYYILNETKRLKQLAFKLLEMAVLRNQEIDIKRISVYDLFDSIKTRTITVCEQEHLTIVEKIFTDELYGDEELLGSFLMNCIDNALHASQKGDQILLLAYKENGYTMLEISDQGKGMTQEQVQKVFEPFYRADKSRSSKHGGAGLGLSLCRQIVNIHNAKLELQSELGKGTRIRIILPPYNKSNDTS